MGCIVRIMRVGGVVKSLKNSNKEFSKKFRSVRSQIFSN